MIERAAPAVVAAAHALLADAASPLVIVGGSRWDRGCVRRAAAVRAKRNGLPVAAAFRHQDLFDNRHPHYAGDVGIGINPKLAARVRDADVLLVIGERLGEMTTSGYTLLEPPRPAQRLIHVHPSPDELGRVYQPELAIASTPGEFLAAMNALPSLARAQWREQRTRRERRLRRVARAASRSRRRRHVAASCCGSTRACPTTRSSPTARATTRCGCIASTATAAFARSSRPTPARWATAFRRRSRPRPCIPTACRVSFNGDGCFLMNGQELATAVQYGLAVIFVVIDNGMYGTIRMHQERNYPARVSGTDLVNPDFAALARAYGAHGETVVRTEEFAPAFERAVAAGQPSLMHVKIDPQALTMGASLDAIRAQAMR